MQKDLCKIVSWSARNNMELNENKFNFISHEFHTPIQFLLDLPFACDFNSYTTPKGVTLYPIESVKDLGVTIDSKLSWSLHINKIVDCSKRLTSWILSVFYSRDKEVILTLYKSLIRSRLEYCCPLWHPYKLGEIFGIWI